MMRSSARAAKLRQIAEVLRKLPAEANPKKGAEDGYVQGKAGEYLFEAIKLGAFSEARWTEFRIELQRWKRQGSYREGVVGGHWWAFVNAADWLRTHIAKLPIQADWPSDDPEPNERLRYACPIIADLIELDADRLEQSEGHLLLDGQRAADKPDDTGLVQNPSDRNAYRPASKIIAEHYKLASDDKALRRILQDNPEIRRWKPYRQRLSVHIGDWLDYVDRTAPRPSSKSDDWQPDADEIERRKAAIRQKNSGK